MLDVSVPEVGLQGARVVPLVSQGVAAGVPEHVWVRLEPRALNHSGEVARHFSAACCGIPADYIESERRTVLFTRSANTAIERVFVLIIVSPALVLLMQVKLIACLPEETDCSSLKL